MEESNAPAVTTRSAGMRYGVILSVISIVLFLGMTFADVDMTQGIGRWVSIPVYLVVIYLAQKYYMDNGDGFMSYGQGMGVTWWLGLISSAIYTVFFYIYIKFIDGSFVETIKQRQMDQMAERGMSEEQIDQAMSFAGAFMTPEAMFIFGLVGGIIFILICGLIVTIFTQKKNPEPAI